MIDEKETVASGGEVDEGNKIYIETIKTMKQDIADNYVPKDQYLRKCEENKQLVETLRDGGSLAAEQKADTSETKAELEEHLETDGITNLDYAITSLAHRDLKKAMTGIDEYIPLGSRYSPTQQDIEAAERAAEGLRSMIEEADGSPEVFQALIQRDFVDPQLPVNAKKKR